MNTPWSWLLAILVMGAITFALRALPLALYRQLVSSRMVAALNERLPLCVMVVLLLFSLRGGMQAPGLAAAEWVALAVVAAVHLRWRNPLASVVSGIAALNLALWALA